MSNQIHNLGRLKLLVCEIESFSQYDAVAINAVRIVREIHERSSMSDYLDVLNELDFLCGQCENGDVRERIKCAIGIVGELAIAYHGSN